MALVQFIELEPQVLSTLPACPTPTIIREVRNAARELCEVSECLRTPVENEPVSAGITEVEFDIDENYTLVRPIQLNLAGTTLEPTSQTLLDADDPFWRSTVGKPCKYMRSAEILNGIVLYPIPDRAYTTDPLKGEIAVKPSRAATGVDEIIMDRFETALVSGALSRLLVVSNSPWYNPQQAAYHRQFFDAEILRAKAYGNGGDLPKRRVAKYGGL